MKVFQGRDCVNHTGQFYSNDSWGSLSFLEISNSCFDESAQFRFRDNGAMLNIQKQGCLAAFNRNGSGYNLDMFYLFIDSVSLDNSACAQKPSKGIYRAIKHTPEKGLSVYYKGKNKHLFQRWCVEKIKQSKNTSMTLTTQCNSTASIQPFIFGTLKVKIIFL